MATTTQPVTDFRFCRNCEFNLHGSVDRCPECGRTFDPHDPATFVKQTGWERRRSEFLQPVQYVLVVGTLGYLACLCLLLHASYGLYGTVILTVLMLGLAPIARGYRLALLVALVYGPPLISTARACVDYASGNFRITGTYVPCGADWHIDPELRCPRRESAEQNSLQTYHVIGTGLIRWLGPMEGSYAGPIPTANAVWAATDAALPILEWVACEQSVLGIARTTAFERPIPHKFSRWGDRNVSAQISIVDKCTVIYHHAGAQEIYAAVCSADGLLLTEYHRAVP